MPVQSLWWLRAGRIVFGVLVIGVAVYLVVVGPDAANVFVSGAGLVVALLALGAPYLLPVTGGTPVSGPDHVEGTGDAEATGGGEAVSGADLTGDGGPVRVSRSGNARADGPGSTATSGVVRRPRS
ncbi:hypothetical protein GCM10009827_109900 [Dactylosporangium maewongense]|uniref:Uncharacterized protein n=1 Tax=Dactylosporangium maewongense TaxID=634393 RepID=A0ABN2D7H2_9ACTN